MLHQVALLHKVVEVPCSLYRFLGRVIRVALIKRVPNALKQVLEVVVSDRKFVKQPIKMEKLKAKMKNGFFIECLTVFENIEFPLVKVLHYLTSVSLKHFLSNLNDRQDSFFLFFLKLVRIRFIILSVYFFEEIIQISFEPLGCVIDGFSCHVEPGLSLYSLALFLRLHIEVEVVEFVGLDNFNSLLGFFFDAVVEILGVDDAFQDLDH